MRKVFTNLPAVLACIGLLMPAVGLADSGFYIGASAGGATFEADLNDPTIPGLPASIDEDDTAIKVFAGYRFDLPAIDVAIEAGYVDLGEPEVDVLGDQLAIETTGINAWGIASFDAGLVDIFGKLGLISWDAEASFQGITASEDGTDIGYGVGLAVGLGPVSVRGEYEIYDLDDTDVAMLSLGIVFQFD